MRSQQHVPGERRFGARLEDPLDGRVAEVAQEQHLPVRLALGQFDLDADAGLVTLTSGVIFEGRVDEGAEALVPVRPVQFDDVVAGDSEPVLREPLKLFLL